MKHTPPKVSAQFISTALRHVSLDPTGQGVFLDFEAHDSPGEALRIAMFLPDARGIPAAMREFADMLERALQRETGQPLN